MSQDDEFQYRLARSRTREASTLTIATVASSASLVLLGLYIQAQIEVNWNLAPEIKLWIAGVGIAFSAVGIIYREVTAKTIHRIDENWLKQRCHITDPRGQGIVREILLVALLAIPIVAWLIPIFY